MDVCNILTITNDYTSRLYDAQRVYPRAPPSLLFLVRQLLFDMPRARSKRRPRRHLPHRNPYHKLSKEEIRLAKMWHKEDGMDPSEIGELLRRDKSTMTRLLVKQLERKKDGRPQLLDTAAVDELVAHLDHMVVTADGKYEVTVDKLRRLARARASCRTISRALHARRIFFRRMREKPVLTSADVRDRKKFANTYQGKRAGWWTTFIDMHIDVKHFPVYLNANARAHAASAGVRGAYRTAGQGLEKPYVKQGKKCQFNTGARGIMVLAGVGHGKVLVWEVIDGRNWNGEVAAEMYAGPIRAALANACPRKRKWRVLEDNDPAGFKCRKGFAAKSASGIESFDIPRRSPGLNVCDYALWSEVSRRMRATEATWPAGRAESRKAYVARLRRTALRLPARFVNASIANMRTRCQRLHAAGGGHFEEGGSTTR